MKITRALIASAAFLIILLIVYYVHVNYFKVDVVLYAAIADGVLASFIAGVALVWLKLFRPLAVSRSFN